MSLTTVGVLRGGPSGEYEISLQTGSSVLRHMPERYKAVDILIDKEGVWHKGGIPMEPERALRQIDAVFNALHGEYGEDGKVQRLLDCLHVPYTGSGSFASA
ncbi:MAG: D-alanine--D-alanine ligase, partial [Patescibacteria group bacterium]